eukprot:59259-Lingulodinium_polyedra.AAC.1
MNRSGPITAARSNCPRAPARALARESTPQKRARPLRFASPKGDTFGLTYTACLNGLTYAQ